ncbi:MAG: flagellar motor protein MotB [Lachnospiraceae bacterium]|nr:flagellar motor protein MotB [Lachnospiraceae bacterium]
MKQRQEEAPKGSPAWMSTFSDLMNLLLCFFVLLFSMSTVDAEKFQEIVAAMQHNISFMPSGGSTIEKGILISSGASHLTELDNYYTNMGVNVENAEQEGEYEGNPFDKVEEEQREESENMAADIGKELVSNGMANQVDVIVSTQYVTLNIKSGILFDSGIADLRPDAIDTISKIGDILKEYDGYTIEIIGHTDNVPINTPKFEDNIMLSMYRAHSVYSYLVEVKKFDATTIKSSGMGENAPIASNATAEGRSQNRRVEIRIYNKLSGI